VDEVVATGREKLADPQPTASRTRVAHEIALKVRHIPTKTLEAAARLRVRAKTT
jgi:hypothetical protein